MLFILAILIFDVHSVGAKHAEDHPHSGSERFVLRKPAYDEEAVRDVLRRLPPWVNEMFSAIEIDEDDLLQSGSGEVEELSNGKLRIRAKAPTDALFAINTYLREYCETLITWSGSSFGDCKRNLTRPLKVTAPRVRYFGNQRAFSYSFLWWTWTEWEQFIDWLALNGFNMILAPIGQEHIYREVFMELGLSAADVDTFFTGEAFLAWHRLGNLKHFGGGISTERMKEQLHLNKKIVSRLVSLGMIPVLPTFAGFVPDAFTRLFPDATFVKNNCWSNSTDSCLYSIHPSESLFQEIAEMFVKKQTEIYGDVTSVYSADPFNEIKTPTVDSDFLRSTSEAIWKGCKRGNENCIWMVQSSSFNHKSWRDAAVKSFLSGVPIGSLIVLDVQAEKEPMWLETSSFFGHYFIWCLMHNTDGRRQFRGNFDVISSGYSKALHSEQRMIGGGMTTAAINQNYVIYQFLIDQLWSSAELDASHWLRHYGRSRYGSEKSLHMDKVWKVLLNTVYKEPTGHSSRNLFIYERPTLEGSSEYYYDMYKLMGLSKSLKHLNGTIGNNELFRQDYSDILRAIKEYEVAHRGVERVREGYGLNDPRMLKGACSKLDQMFHELDELANDEHHNMQSWILAARTNGNSKHESDLLERQTVHLLTLWDPTESNNGSTKEWGGVIRQFNAKRWRFLCEYLSSGIRYNERKFQKRLIEEFEKPFTAI